MILETLQGKSGAARVTIQKFGDGYLIGVTTHPSDIPRSLTRYKRKTYWALGEAEKAALELIKIT